MRWVLRHGVANVPPEWQDHIDGCNKCREFIANINALDTALAKGDVPDPGKEYWEGFAPSVARRIDELQNAPQRLPERKRWGWTRVWAPAVGVAALAFLIGRELSRDYTTKPTVMDSEIPIQAPTTSGTTAGLHDDTAPEPAPAGDFIGGDTKAHEEEVADITQPQRGPQHAPKGTGATIAAQPESKDHHDAEGTSDLPGNVANELDMGAIEESTIPSLAERRSPDVAEVDDETNVWPDRRVQTLGQLGQDANGKPTLDDARLSEQGSPGLAERRSWTSSGAETSGTPSPLARLEGRQTFRSATLPDSQSPTEAMRRFDELTGLREQIAELEAIDADDRTPSQSRDLCAMWYRAGQITLDPAELDRAIQRMDMYIAELSDALRLEWLAKKRQLVIRRATLNR